MVRSVACRFHNLQPGGRPPRQLYGLTVPHRDDVGSHCRLEARGTQNGSAHWLVGDEHLLFGLWILDDVLAGAAVPDAWRCYEWQYRCDEDDVSAPFSVLNL